MISLVSDEFHPILEKIIHILSQFRKGNYIVGTTDDAEHPVYQTKWIKLRLSHLGLHDPYKIPSVFDSYSAIFWMCYKEEHAEGPRFSEEIKEPYPYLG